MGDFDCLTDITDVRYEISNLHPFDPFPAGVWISTPSFKEFVQFHIFIGDSIPLFKAEIFIK